MQPIWSGFLQFGLVSVPIKVYSATKPPKLQFHLLHKEDLDRIYYEKVCPEHGEVDWGQVVRGYEYTRGKYVTLSEDEFQKVDPQAARTVEVMDFVKLEEVSLLQLKNSYWIIPEYSGRKAYFLLADVLAEERKVAIAKVVLRTRQFVVIIRPEGPGLVMTVMVFKSELRDPRTMGLPTKIEPRKSEREMAKQIVASMTVKYNIAAYKNEYAERLESYLNAKIKGKKYVPPKTKSRKPIKNFVEALKRSPRKVAR